ncbi:hypothetical protein QTO34_000238 [Cnephaeus nilssonii]|uniref:L1 transposable element dsRBD-like domain-containing protein n=1 Tax=Cnephaeus nilssonii TaxID=3371016 RepID=A0AA40IB76_CNENI|nr:hypothetical protein QTO34_000238 [Eptesicus nilssonii]
MQARREWQEIFKVMNSKNLQPRFLYPAKLSFRIEGQIKNFTDKKKLKEFITTKPVLYEMLKKRKKKKKREFSALLLEVDSTYSGLLMYNNVRWLSRGNVLECFVECFEEIKVFNNRDKETQIQNQRRDQAKAEAQKEAFQLLATALMNPKQSAGPPTVVSLVLLQNRMQVFTNQKVGKIYLALNSEPRHTYVTRILETPGRIP